MVGKDQLENINHYIFDKALYHCLAQFYSYSALDHILFKKAYSPNLIKISNILINLNSLNTAGKRVITIFGLGEGQD